MRDGLAMVDRVVRAVRTVRLARTAAFDGSIVRTGRACRQSGGIGRYAVMVGVGQGIGMLDLVAIVCQPRTE